MLIEFLNQEKDKTCQHTALNFITTGKQQNRRRVGVGERSTFHSPALVVELTKGGGPDARWVVMGETVAFWTPVTG